MTLDGAVLGTPHYMSPEQLRGEISTLDERSDVWSLGVCLYRAVSGELPFPGSSAIDVHERIKEAPKPLPSGLPTPLRRALQTIVERCLTRAPEDRYSSARGVCDDLERARAGRPLANASTSVWSRAARGLRKRAPRLGIATLILAVASFAAWKTRDLLLENHRLEYINDVKSAYGQLRPRLEPILARADRARYEDSEPERRRALVQEADLLIDSIEDDTGVGAAFKGWVRWLVLDPAGDGAIDDAVRAHPENPVTSLVSAWRHIRRFAETEPWPVDAGVKFYTLGGTRGEVAPEPKPDDEHLVRAMTELQRARDTETWSRVPELRWVEDVCEGFELYSRGELTSAIERLESIGTWIDVEPNLILSFAHFRAGNDEDRAGSSLRLDRAETRPEARHPSPRVVPPEPRRAERSFKSARRSRKLTAISSVRPSCWSRSHRNRRQTERSARRCSSSSRLSHGSGATSSPSCTKSSLSSIERWKRNPTPTSISRVAPARACGSRRSAPTWIRGNSWSSRAWT